MRHPNLDALIANGRASLTDGPVALVFAEDDIEVTSTLVHHIALGFRSVVLFAPDSIEIAPDLSDRITRVDYNPRDQGAVTAAVNRVIAAANGVWFYYCYNAEYLFFSFSESRTVADLLAFHTEERRDAMLTYVVDLYAGDLSAAENGVAPDDAYLDKSGYYALARDGIGGPKERQLDFYGGLRWRFEEHVPKNRRRIDRIALFRARPGLALLADHTFNDEEYNTYACPWHHNLTASIASFRTAKALRVNAGSRESIENFRWHNSVRFEWDSQQLLELGLIEPGQWF